MIGFCHRLLTILHLEPIKEASTELKYVRIKQIRVEVRIWIVVWVWWLVSIEVWTCSSSFYYSIGSLFLQSLRQWLFWFCNMIGKMPNQLKVLNRKSDWQHHAISLLFHLFQLINNNEIELFKYHFRMSSWIFKWKLWPHLHIHESHILRVGLCV